MKTFTEDEIRQAVEDFPEGCREKKNEFLDQLGIKPAKGYGLITLCVPVDEFDAEHISNDGAYLVVGATAIDSGMYETLERDADCFDHYDAAVRAGKHFGSIRHYKSNGP